MSLILTGCHRETLFLKGRLDLFDPCVWVTIFSRTPVLWCLIRATALWSLHWEKLGNTERLNSFYEAVSSGYSRNSTMTKYNWEIKIELLIFHCGYSSDYLLCIVQAEKIETGRVMACSILIRFFTTDRRWKIINYTTFSRNFRVFMWLHVWFSYRKCTTLYPFRLNCVFNTKMCLLSVSHAIWNARTIHLKSL